MPSGLIGFARSSRQAVCRSSTIHAYKTNVSKSTDRRHEKSRSTTQKTWCANSSERAEITGCIEVRGLRRATCIQAFRLRNLRRLFVSCVGSALFSQARSCRSYIDDTAHRHTIAAAGSHWSPKGSPRPVVGRPPKEDLSGTNDPAIFAPVRGSRNGRHAILSEPVHAV